MKKLLLPGLIVAMGLGGAYASNKLSSKAMPTYRIEGSQCVQVQQECDEFSGEVCTWNEDNSSPLYKFRSADETTCSQELSRKIQ